VDYVKLERALATLTASLPDHAHWAALTTLDGKIIRYYPTILDGDHIATLTHTLMTQSRHALSELKNGEFRYLIAAGTEGFYLIFLLEGTYLLGVNIEQINSLDAIIIRVPVDLAGLIELANDEDHLP